MKIIMLYGLEDNDEFLYCQVSNTIINQFVKFKQNYNYIDLTDYLYNKIKDADFYGISNFNFELAWNPQLLEKDKIIARYIKNNLTNKMIFEQQYKNDFNLLRFADTFQNQFSQFLYSKIFYFDKYIMPKQYFKQYIQFLNKSLSAVDNEFKVVVFPLLTSYFLFKNKNNIKNTSLYMINRNNFTYGII